MTAALCWFVDRKCIVPLLTAIDAIKSGAARRTNIQEIDDLLEFMTGNDSGKDGAGNNAPGRDLDMSGFYEFKENISTLSKAEKGIFDLYMQGRSAPEIAELLYISINTVKTHNKNIYRKLNVSSRKALMVYIQMMKGA